MSAKPETNASKPPTANQVGSGLPTIPTWADEDHFIDVIQKEVSGFKKIVKFDANFCGGAGENFSSQIIRVMAIVELECGSKKDVSYMLKTMPANEASAMMINMMGHFPKELAMYHKYLPEFEQMYSVAGMQITFTPKCYTLEKNPKVPYVLLEDLGLLGFKNVNRREGLDKEHTESVLRILAQFHAASAVKYETKNDYDAALLKGIFTENHRELICTMFKGMQNIFLECLSKSDVCAKYVEQVKRLLDTTADNFIKQGNPDLNDFNVINHGDLWTNNIMFRHNDEGKLEETILIDFQISRYGSPVIDLYYFLLSSIALDLKVSHFDSFVKYYHDHLVENLKLLNYPKKVPTLKELHMDLLKHSFWAMSTVTTTMSAALLDPTSSDAIIDNMFKEGDTEKLFKVQMYRNPRYVKHIETVLPWLVERGLLD